MEREATEREAAAVGERFAKREATTLRAAACHRHDLAKYARAAAEGAGRLEAAARTCQEAGRSAFQTAHRSDAEERRPRDGGPERSVAGGAAEGARASFRKSGRSGGPRPRAS